MKRILTATLAGSAMLALGACEVDHQDAMEQSEAPLTEAAPPPVDEAVTDTGDETRDSVSISEDGVEATVNDGDTSVSADVDEDPSMTVETE